MTRRSDHVFSYRAPVTCPVCQLTFTGLWVGSKTGEQMCWHCETRFDATWPGFEFPAMPLTPPGLTD